MFLGHFGVALAAKKAAPEISLGTLVLAAQLADGLWPIFLLLGWERVRIAPGITRASPLDFVHYPITHSLVGQLAWGAALGLLYFALRRNAKNALVIGACVVSHWVLDAIVHRPDMPGFPHGPFVGLGLWNSLPATVVVECGLLAIGLAVYLRTMRAKDRIGVYALWSFIAVLVAGWISAVFGPPPPNARALAFGALAMWLTVPWAAWADRHRELRQSPQG
jgi:membrane-bound metal-dependent hydrolase YbcI (DUF457 family)